MIDPHVHLRDWRQSAKETLVHGLQVACRAGLDAVFEMPNTTPPIISERLAEERIALADQAAQPIFHGLYIGLTAKPAQIHEAVGAYQRLFPRVVGLKLFAGRSTGTLSVIAEADQRLVWRTLVTAGYRGVVAVHCEKEACFQPHLWEPEHLSSHSQARPPASESASVRDMLRLASEAGFKGTLHVCHISVPEALHLIEGQDRQAPFKTTCGLTPHHALLTSEDAENSRLLKVNPPLRSRELQEEMLRNLLAERISWIESDHAPHTLEDKPQASGLPVLPFLPHFLRFLQEKGLGPSQLQELTHNRICEVFGLEIKNTKRKGEYALAGEYPFDPFAVWKKSQLPAD